MKIKLITTLAAMTLAASSTSRLAAASFGDDAAFLKQHTDSSS